MKVFKDLRLEIPETNVHFFNLDKYSEDSDTDVLLYGYKNSQDRNLFNTIKNYKRKVYLNVTMPTEYCGKVNTLQDNHFDEVYGICPYSVKWLNKITNSDKYKLTFYPFNENDIPDPTEKKYDVCYHGGLHSSEYVDMLGIISKFNYRYMSLTHDINSLTRQWLPKYLTNANLNNKSKLELISECKISICYNTFPIRGQKDINNIKSRNRWQENEAFKHIDDLRIAPQFKSRFNEAAMCRTLNLIKRDPWNVVEEFYTPNEEFIYFDSNDELENKITEILDNWDDYQHIIKNAYLKSMNYTTSNLYKKIKNNYT